MDIDQNQIQHHHKGREQGEPEMMEQEEAIPLLGITSFREISSIREVKIILFQAVEDNKYICKYLVALYKCSLYVSPPLNEAVGNFAVVLIPSIKGNA